LKGKSPKKEPSKRKNLLKNGPSKKLFVKNRFFNLAGLAIIILLGIIIYSNSFKCSFHFDDLNNITNNKSIHNLYDVKAWFNYSPNRPVSMFTFVLNYHFNQLDVTYYHVVNLCIHLINACLVWWLTLLIFSSHAMKDSPVSKYKKTLALFTALLFVSHPLATQSVTYIIQRQNSMAAMFYFLSLAFYLKARLSGMASKLNFLLFAGSLIFAFLAIFSKENAFTLPFAIILLEIFFLQTKKLTINFRNYRFILLAAAFLSFIIIILIKFPLSIFDPLPPSQGNICTITSQNYLLTQFSVIIKYIQLLVLPINQNLDYDFPISNSFFELRTLLSFLLLLSLITLAIFLFKKHRIFSFGIFWFFITLSIESSIVPINDIIFEHRTYLPSFGFFLILSTGVFTFLWKKYKKLSIFLFVIIIGSYSMLTYKRNYVWKDDLTLWKDVVLKSPDKARPYHNRGSAYGDIGQHITAITDFTKTIELDSTYVMAYYNRGVSYEKTGQWEKALADYSKAIQIDSKYSSAYSNRGVVLGTHGQLDEAISDFSKAIALDANFVAAYYNRGYTYACLGKLENALADYQKTIELNPDYLDAYCNRGIVYFDLGQLDKAIEDYTIAIKKNPKLAIAYSNRGFARAKLGQWDQAIADYSTAIELEPNLVTAYNNRGNAYLNIGQLEKAIADYSNALIIDPNSPDAHNNREVAYRKLNSAKNQRKNTLM